MVCQQFVMERNQICMNNNFFLTRYPSLFKICTVSLDRWQVWQARFLAILTFLTIVLTCPPQIEVHHLLVNTIWLDICTSVLCKAVSLFRCQILCRQTICSKVSWKSWTTSLSSPKLIPFMPKIHYVASFVKCLTLKNVSKSMTKHSSNQSPNYQLGTFKF